MRLLLSVGCIPLALGAVVLGGCRQENLGTGAQVATSQSAPVDSGWDPASCESLGFIIGRGGGTFGGGWLPNEKLIEYAMNDLRNQAANRGANFVQHDSPTMGIGGDKNSTTTTTATVSGTAYKCSRKADPKAGTVVVAAPAGPTTACVPGATQACVGPGGCNGGQFCLDDGSKYSPCDCGGKAAADASAVTPAAAPAGATAGAK
jgi:hypothetical protein